MDKLPVELLSIIIEQLWEEPPDRGPRLTHPRARSSDALLINLRSVRLVCKGFCKAASNIFGETYFQVRWVSMSRKSLLDLIEISESTKFGCHVHTLRISAVRFDKQLHDEGQSVLLLSKALKNLDGKLTSTMLSIKCSERTQGCQDEAKIMEAVTHALFRSKVQLSRLRIYTNKPSILTIPSDTLRTPHTRNMQHLRSLKLDFLNASTLDTETHQMLSQGSISRFLNTLPSLQSLSIFFASEIWYRTPLNKIFGSGTHKNLTTLRLCGFNAREAELSNFLIRHHEKLRSLELADFKLRNGQWRSVFSTIRYRLSLERLWFRRIWDRLEAFSLSDESFQGYVRSDFDNVDWDSIASPRENSDLDLEPVQLGETGMFITFPEDLLYDPDDVDDDDNVNPIPYFAHELLHPGHAGHDVDIDDDDDMDDPGTGSSREQSVERFDVEEDKLGVFSIDDDWDMEKYLERYDYDSEEEDYMHLTTYSDGSGF
ncbi:hypothetical protein K432DRAFT_414177 [Lepidopterella palustris CBS 459.81]|uniref:Uncharacterized protein n=1 Tax=Lepidopterella palustris CBS 459.81 TaxID=1314670 RepID=A0A8E2EHM6_9PEZI|nr:hypothetical protein K432DRAFT_414177 [Lepidopterella palustris CBS 459.81]